MTISRRAVVAGLGASLILPAPAFAAGGRRVFDVLRGGDPIGTQLVDVRPGPEGSAEVVIEVELKVKILGITAYRYEMENREVWKGGRLISMNSRVNDDGDADHARAEAAGEVIEIDGSLFRGAVPADAVSTTYWSRAFLNRKVWINTQTGVPIEVAATPLGAGEVQGRATERFNVKGGNLDVVLHYAGEEWISIEFDAGGEPAIYLPQDLSAAFAPVWTASL